MGQARGRFLTAGGPGLGHQQTQPAEGSDEIVLLTEPRHPRGPPPPAAVAESRACPLPACLTSHPFFIPSQAEAARLPAWPPWALRLPRALTPPPWGPGAWKRAGCRCWELARGLSVRRRD